MPPQPCLALFCSLTAVACGPVAPKVDLAAEEQKIHQLTDALVAVEVRHDVDGMLGYYAADAVVQMPGGPAIAGREGIRAAAKEFLATTPFTDELVTGRTVVVSSSGDLAYDIGPDILVNKTATGSTQELGKSIIIYRKVAGQWKIVANSYSTDTPTAAPAPPPAPKK